MIRSSSDISAGVTIAWTYVDCMEKIEEIKDYEWAQSIAETLNASMHKFHDKPRDATGCVLALMYWICEHTDLIARPTNEAIPRLLNWNTSHLKKAFDDFEDLSNANITVYENELQETSQEAQVYNMAHPEVVDDNAMEIIPHLMHHTQSSQRPAVQQLDDIPLTETQQTSPLMLTSSPYQQPQSGETMVPSTYQLMDSINEHNQMSILEDLQQLQNLEQQNYEFQNDKDTLKNELEEMEQERDALKQKTEVLEKASDAMKNQLLEMEEERDSLQEKLQNMDTMSNVFKQERDELEKQLLEMGKERDSFKETLQHSENKIVQTFELNTADFEKQKQMMLQEFEDEKNKIKKALTMQIESLTTEKHQLQKDMSTIDQRQKAILVQKDAEICSLTNKLSLASKLSVQQ